MPPNKSKRPFRDESPEQDGTKKPRPDTEEDEDDKELQDGDKNKASCSKSGGKVLRSPSVSSHNKPAELFRKDLISAMKLADSEPLNADNYHPIADQWKQDWEKGVQVPVNSEAIPTANISEKSSWTKTGGDFKIPRKFLHAIKDESFQQSMHEFTGMQQLSESVVRYDLDDLDVCWLQKANEEREENAETLIHEWTMERIIEALENQCYEKMQNKKKTEEGLGIEYDEDVVCEVCRSPDSEDNNEMVFCDGCDICVHQACYGIQKIPEGSWLCRVCALGIKPRCILCPKIGGAMKSTRSGTKWAHVSCSLWIPEVTIGCVEKMEPITKISQIPASRWALICCLCKERTGACIQCSVKACKTAFHVTCAFQYKLEMRTILTENESDEGIKLKGYCPRHSKNREHGSADSDTDSPRKSISGSPRKELTDEEIARMRAEKLKQLEEEFYREIDTDEISNTLQVDPGTIEHIAAYWKLKRKTMFDTPLLMPKTEEEDMLEKQQEDSLIARMKMFVQLRQDLERVRNLCYMVGKREKMKKQFYKLRENVFMGQVSVLTDNKLSLTDREAKRIAEKYHHHSIYDWKTVEKYGFNPPPIVDEEKDEDDPFLVLDIPEEPLLLNLNAAPVGSLCEEIPKIDFECKQKFSQRTDKVCKKVFSQRKAKHVKRKLMKAALTVEQNDEEEIDVVSDTGLVKDPLNGLDSVSEPEQEVTEKSRWRSRHRQHSQKVDVQQEKEEATDTYSDKGPDSEFREKRTRASFHAPEEVTNSKTKTPVKEEQESTCCSFNLSSEIEVKTEKVDKESECDVVEEVEDSGTLVGSRELRSASVKSEASPTPEELSKPKPNGKVSDRVKSELNQYMRMNKLVVPDKIKMKVQRGLFRASSKSRLKQLNGLFDRKQTRLDSFFKNGKKTDIAESALIDESTSVNGRKSESRVLNEISPSKTRHSGNSWYGSPAISPKGYRSPPVSPRSSLGNYRIPKKSSTGDGQIVSRAGESNSVTGLMNSSPRPETRSSRRRGDILDSNSRDSFSRRSSRENSPDSTISLQSRGSTYRGLGRVGDGDRVLTRASSPASSYKSLDHHTDYIDVENLFHEADIAPKRVTRSQISDSECSRDSTDSSTRRSLSHVRSLMS
ncbi:protein Jade-3-like [Mizuhopecten yessoensis]|uniref:Protein Jade-1 n=1 Tax=Mizuhopecten yessoensis TaxID=6573 RepID=A0A210PLA6_MIZYE|nr:protein Jade-3-like [Mizuhopecten yessoensis]OWF37269.1 Protein Jade-1 [Mizuhopecten yessoensis]